jgi:hypothetical protein
MVQLKARAQTPGFDDLLDAMIESTWKSSLKSGLAREIQLQTQQMMLTWMLALYQNDLSGYAVKSICFSRLQQIKQLAIAKKSTPGLGAHYSFAIERIEKPKDIPLPLHKEIPPGAPIGCDLDY